MLKDLPIIGGFLNNIRCKADKQFKLYFKDGTIIISEFLGCGDSDNELDLDDPYYEDLYEFYFMVKKIEQKGLEIDYKENEGIALNYHNFFIKFKPYEEQIWFVKQY